MRQLGIQAIYPKKHTSTPNPEHKIYPYLWRTVKYEDIYLKHYRTIEETFTGLQNYFPFYNSKRRHQSLDYKTPAEIYFGDKR
jgi:transposase InsO family protein